MFCPILKEFKKRLVSVLPDKFRLFTDCSPLEFEDYLNRSMSPDDLDTLDKLEIDISKYDKSQGEILFEFELEIYRLFGVTEEHLQQWRVAHEFTVLYDQVNRLKFDIEFQRKSGNASTYIGNTLVLMGVVATLFDLGRVKYEYGMFSGDDSLLIGGVVN